jgi:hypothetical protein
MSWRKVLGVPVVLVLLLAGIFLMVEGTYGTGSSPAIAHRPDEIQEALATQGGPDPFGYTYVNSDEPGGATFDWIDASAGTPLNPDDKEAVYVPLPFTFTFYGEPFSDMAIYSEGALFLGMPPSYTPNENEPLTTTSLTDLIAPFWDNFAAGSGLVYYLAT